jgi:hypothetical protein
MRPKTDEVLAGLKQHATGQRNAMRSNTLARKVGLPPRIVSNALNWLVVDSKHPDVRREQELRAHWYKYWWNDSSK